MAHNARGACSGKICGYTAYNGELGCESGSGSCWEATFLEADETSFHDATLQRATREIKAIIDAIPPDSDGRKLSFIHTEKGTLLAWVRHGVVLPDNRVTVESPFDKIAEALKLKGCD